jgi:predicted transcriptional regulator
MNKFPIITEFASAEVPLFLEKKNKNIVWFGADNLYPFELIDLYNDSSTHNAIVNGKVGYIVGNGLDSDDIEVKKWLSSANIDQDWTSLLKSLTLDYELFNGYAIEVIKTSVGNQYHHIDFANIRVGLDGSIKYADDWLTDKGVRNSRPEIQELERYNPRNPEQKRGVIYHVDYRPNLKYYPLPVYVGSLAEIRTDVQIGDYWLNEVKNGFVGGTLIQHNNGVPETLAESKQFEEAFKEKFGKATGTKIVHLFSPSKENSSEISNLNGNDLHERYINMSERVKESIFIGHRVTNPILFGVKEQNSLGSRSELDLAYEIFTNTYIAERQNTLLRTIKKLAFFEIQRSDIDIIPLKPIDTVDLTSDIILANLTRDEIRTMITDQTGLELEEEINVQAAPTFNKISSCSCFSSDEDSKVLNYLKKKGVKKQNYEVIESLDINFDSNGSPKEFATPEQEEKRSIIKILKDNPRATAIAIATALNLSFEKIVDYLLGLMSDGIIKSDESELTLTNLGDKVANGIKIPKAEIKYQYQLRSDAPELKKNDEGVTIGESRKFCTDMMEDPDLKGRYWSKEEIEGMSNDMTPDDFSNASNVWLARGGWYQPIENEGESKASIPYCRHEWNQVIVRKK